MILIRTAAKSDAGGRKKADEVKEIEEVCERAVG
jgi:hypothetical protein